MNPTTIKDPVLTKPFTMFEINEFKDSKKVLRTGVGIQLAMQDHATLSEKEPEYSAMHEKNCVYIRVPVLSHAYKKLPAVYKRGNKAIGNTQPRVVEGWTVSRNQHVKLPESALYVIYQLQFPKNLDNSVFSKDMDGGELKPEIIPISRAKRAQDDEGDEYLQVTTTLVIEWKIAELVEAEEMRETKIKKKTNLYSAGADAALAARVGNIFIEGEDDGELSDDGEDENMEEGG